MTLQNTAHPSCGVVQDKTQILTQVYPNVIVSIPYTVSAVVCMGLWSARAGQVLQMSPSKQTAPLGVVGECPIFTAEKCVLLLLS